jgi:hypothetical protein
LENDTGVSSTDGLTGDARIRARVQLDHFDGNFWDTMQVEFDMDGDDVPDQVSAIENPWNRYPVVDLVFTPSDLPYGEVTV